MAALRAPRAARLNPVDKFAIAHDLACAEAHVHKTGPWIREGDQILATCCATTCWCQPKDIDAPPLADTAEALRMQGRHAIRELILSAARKVAYDSRRPRWFWGFFSRRAEAEGKRLAVDAVGAFVAANVLALTDK